MEVGGCLKIVKRSVGGRKVRMFKDREAREEMEFEEGKLLLSYKTKGVIGSGVVWASASGLLWVKFYVCLPLFLFSWTFISLLVNVSVCQYEGI